MPFPMWFDKGNHAHGTRALFKLFFSRMMSDDFDVGKEGDVRIL
jgi:hypothetical protein